MIESKIYYFNNPGRRNTNDVIKIVKERLLKNDIKYIVIASATGNTALKLLNEIENKNLNIVVVTYHAGFRENDKITMSENTMKEIKNKGAKVFIGSHALSEVGRSITNKFGGITPVELIASTLRLFGGHGIKVAIEVSIMAADAGLIPTDENIISIGGTNTGIDTAIVIKPAHMNNFFDLEIKEILAKPIKRDKK